MKPEDLKRLSKVQLLTIAQEKKIKNRSKMTKGELVEVLHTEGQTKKETGVLPIPSPSEPFIAQVSQMPEERRQERSDFDLPSSYNQTQVVLMIRDPYRLYSYWDLRSELKTELAAIYSGWEKVPLSLRVYNLSQKRLNTDEPDYFDLSVNPLADNWFIPVVGPNRQYQVDLGYYSPTGDFIKLATSNQVTTPRDGPSETLDEEWMIVEEDFRRLYRLAGGGRIGEGSIEMVESFLKRLEKEVGSGAISSISSPARIREKERGFWVVLDTELIVYGATEPDATLTIQGQPVRLRPDGSFTLRMALPEGTQVIPVTALSQDGVDSITITPMVTKETR